MEPKEKAKQLVDKFRKYVDTDFAGDKGFEYSKEAETYHAKQCALIAVDYIITSNPHSNPFNTDVYSTMSYWQEVKTEIEKL
jgi:hypothetical protein